MGPLRCRWSKLVPDLSSLRFAYLKAPSAAPLSIQIQVLERELSPKLLADPYRRIRYTDVDTRGDEAGKGESLRSSTTRASGEDRTEGQPSVGGGPINRIQDLWLDKLTNGIPAMFGGTKDVHSWQQHKREKACRTYAGVFSRNQAPLVFYHAIAITTSVPLDRVSSGILVPLSHCPLKTALISFLSRRPPLSFISNVNPSSKCHGNLSCPLRQPRPMSISLEIVPIAHRLELEGEPDGS